MPYDFEYSAEKQHSGTSKKWSFELLRCPLKEGRSHPIPMWLADMDFQTAPAVVEALQQAVATGRFGYSCITEAYGEAVAEWQRRRYGWTVDPGWMLQTAGVVAALSLAVQTFTVPGDAVLIQTPVYARFGKLCHLHGRRSVTAPLRERCDSYAFDADEFAAVIRRERPKIFFLCNPHNPVGKVWRQDELHAMADLCLRHGVLVVSDEVHADLVIAPDCRHVLAGDN